MTHTQQYPRPGDIIRPAGNAGIYVQRAGGALSLNAFAGGTQYRFTLDLSQAAALADQLVSEADGTVIVHAAADVFLSQFDTAHRQG